MSEHTKGPWVIDFDDQGGEKYGIVVTSDVHFGDICHKVSSVENARLIAILELIAYNEELREMVERVCKQYQNVRDADPAFNGIPSSCIRDARALLAKAPK